MTPDLPLELLAQLAVLALIDSTSFGTLLIPLWLMLAPGKLRPGRVLVFLGTVAAFYLVLGIALLAGATVLYTRLGAWLEGPVAGYLQLALGVGLFVGSFFIGRKKNDDDATSEGGEAARRPGRLTRWRARAMGDGDGRSSLLALMGLALGAALVESASMLPYLAAIGILTGADLPAPTAVGVLALYCVVMILPALVLLAARVVAAGLVRRPLERVEAWMTRSAAETTAWIVGILGFLVARDALVRTGILEQFGVVAS